MPYISKSDRVDLDKRVFPPTNPGELNYYITKAILGYLSLEGESYRTYNAIIGVLECCKLELYRRKIGPYEDRKKKENGDVY